MVIPTIRFGFHINIDGNILLLMPRPVTRLSFSISSSSSSDSDEGSLSEGEIEALKEQVEEKKKLLATIRNQPWRMKRRLVVLK